MMLFRLCSWKRAKSFLRFERVVHKTAGTLKGTALFASSVHVTLVIGALKAWLWPFGNKVTYLHICLHQERK